MLTYRNLNSKGKNFSTQWRWLIVILVGLGAIFLVALYSQLAHAENKEIEPMTVTELNKPVPLDETKYGLDFTSAEKLSKCSFDNIEKYIIDLENQMEKNASLENSVLNYDIESKIKELGKTTYSNLNNVLKDNSISNKLDFSMQDPSTESYHDYQARIDAACEAANEACLKADPDQVIFNQIKEYDDAAAKEAEYAKDSMAKIIEIFKAFRLIYVDNLKKIEELKAGLENEDNKQLKNVNSSQNQETVTYGTWVPSDNYFQVANNEANANREEVNNRQNQNQQMVDIVAQLAENEQIKFYNGPGLFGNDWTNFLLNGWTTQRLNTDLQHQQDFLFQQKVIDITQWKREQIMNVGSSLYGFIIHRMYYSDIMEAMARGASQDEINAIKARESNLKQGFDHGFKLLKHIWNGNFVGVFAETWDIINFICDLLQSPDYPKEMIDETDINDKVSSISNEDIYNSLSSISEQLSEGIAGLKNDNVILENQPKINELNKALSYSKNTSNSLDRYLLSNPNNNQRGFEKACSEANKDLDEAVKNISKGDNSNDLVSIIGNDYYYEGNDQLWSALDKVIYNNSAKYYGIFDMLHPGRSTESYIKETETWADPRAQWPDSIGNLNEISDNTINNIGYMKSYTESLANYINAQLIKSNENPIQIHDLNAAQEKFNEDMSSLNFHVTVLCNKLLSAIEARSQALSLETYYYEYKIYNAEKELNNIYDNTSYQASKLRAQISDWTSYINNLDQVGGLNQQKITINNQRDEITKIKNQFNKMYENNTDFLTKQGKCELVGTFGNSYLNILSDSFTDSWIFYCKCVAKNEGLKISQFKLLTDWKYDKTLRGYAYDPIVYSDPYNISYNYGEWKEDGVDENNKKKTNKYIEESFSPFNKSLHNINIPSTKEYFDDDHKRNIDLTINLNGHSMEAKELNSPSLCVYATNVAIDGGVMLDSNNLTPAMVANSGKLSSIASYRLDTGKDYIDKTIYLRNIYFDGNGSKCNAINVQQGGVIAENCIFKNYNNNGELENCIDTRNNLDAKNMSAVRVGQVKNNYTLHRFRTGFINCLFEDNGYKDCVFGQPKKENMKEHNGSCINADWCPLFITGTKFKNNRCTGSGTVAINQWEKNDNDSNDPLRGEAILSIPVVTQTDFTDNYAEKSGGGIDCKNHSLVLLADKFSNNKTSGKGGGVCMNPEIDNKLNSSGLTTTGYVDGFDYVSYFKKQGIIDKDADPSSYDYSYLRNLPEEFRSINGVQYDELVACDSEVGNYACCNLYASEVDNNFKTILENNYSKGSGGAMWIGANCKSGYSVSDYATGTDKQCCKIECGSKPWENNNLKNYYNYLGNLDVHDNKSDGIGAGVFCDSNPTATDYGACNIRFSGFCNIDNNISETNISSNVCFNSTDEKDLRSSTTNTLDVTHVVQSDNNNFLSEIKLHNAESSGYEKPGDKTFFYGNTSDKRFLTSKNTKFDDKYYLTKAEDTIKSDRPILKTKINDNGVKFKNLGVIEYDSYNNNGIVETKSSNLIKVRCPYYASRSDQYIVEDFDGCGYDDNDEMDVFGQGLDFIQYIEEDNKAYWKFDFEGSPIGSIVNIYNSNDKENTLIRALAGNTRDLKDKVEVKKGIHYDTIEFEPMNAVVTNKEQPYIIHLPAGEFWKSLEDDDFVTENWINKYGDTEDKISISGEKIDWIRMKKDGNKSYLVFDTEGREAKLQVTIYNSKDSSVKKKTGTIGCNASWWEVWGDNYWSDTEEIEIDSNAIYDTIEIKKK